MANQDEGEVILQELLNNQLDEFEENIRSNALPQNVGEPTKSPDEKAKSQETYSQWALGGNGRFSPVGATEKRLPAGVYEPFATPGMWGLEQIPVASDGIYVLPDMATELVLTEVSKFWQSEAKYRAHNLLYKRGIMLWGPPGGGKTVAVKLLMHELVKKDGIVVIGSNVPLTIMALKAVRRIESKRNLIVVFEDIDEIIHYHGEAGVLSMLDGESNVDNVLHLATTNFPDKLGARIINRPSRFDRRIYVGMPSPEAREAYLRKATNNGVEGLMLNQWVFDTDEMSVAHLRELVAAVYCLEQPYDEVIKRLKLMAMPIKSEDGFKKKTTGFANSTVGPINQSLAPSVFSLN